MQRDKRLQVTSLKAFILELIMFWIFWFVEGYLWVNGFDIVSGIMSKVLFIGLLFIVLSIILTAIQMKRDFGTNNSLSISKKIGTIILFVVFISMHFNMYCTFSDMQQSTGGLMSIVNKQVEDGKSYFYVKSMDDNDLIRIGCSAEVYDTLIIDEEVGYSFSYRRLTYSGKGVLEGSIDTTDRIDNRR